MTQGAWARRSWPVPGSDTHLVGRWEPATPAELTVHRRELAAALHDGGRPSDADEGAVERLVLVFEELVSNALRHGSLPVCVEITAFGHFWLLDVSDAAVARPPAVAVGRDAAHGGLGLHLVASLCGAHGWTVAHNRKHVWARIDYTHPEAREADPRVRHG
ncbi:ATP-binding protein [Geodermatophilus sp. SYSU D01045]